MKVPTGKDHFKKYAALVKLHGLATYLARETFMGSTPGQLRAQLRKNPYLNNVSTLQGWDARSFHLVGMLQPFDNDGNKRPVPKYGPVHTITISEAVCCMKYLAIFHFAGCEPVFVPIDDPSATDPFPRLPEWD